MALEERVGEKRLREILERDLDLALAEGKNISQSQIKPERISWDELYSLVAEYHHGDFAFMDKNRQLVERMGVRYTTPIRDREEHYEVELIPIIPEFSRLNHDGGLIPRNYEGCIFDFLESDENRDLTLDEIREERIDRFSLQSAYKFYRGILNQISNGGILKYPNKNYIVNNSGKKSGEFTYLKSFDCDYDPNSLGADNPMCIRYEIDVQKLLEKRNIFADPEQFFGTEFADFDESKSGEFGKTFIVPGGIPVSSITNWSFYSS